MRPIVTFLSLFTLLFFLAPVLCRFDGHSEEPPPQQSLSASLPQALQINGEEISTGDLLVEYLMALDVQGYEKEALTAIAAVCVARLRDALEDESLPTEIPRKSEEEAREAWGSYWYSVYRPMMEEAVAKVWNSTWIAAEDASSPAVFPLSWGSTAAGVECPYDFTADGFETTVTVPLKSVQTLFPDCKALTVKKARSGRVESVCSGNTEYSAETVATRFGLPSLCFTAAVKENNVIFTCKGKGNGEGMSLYGANELAKRGATWEEILKTFFPDATVRMQNTR